jgi:hypothetical protein
LPAYIRLRAENSPSKLSNSMTLRLIVSFDPASTRAASRAARARVFHVGDPPP